MGYYTTIVPLELQENLFSFTYPFTSLVWICFLISISTYVGAIIVMNYLQSGSTYWKREISFAIRRVLSEGTDNLPPKHLYKKILVQVWSFMTMILIFAYTGNLLALITRPSINVPFTNTEEMIKQTHMKWGFVDGWLFSEYAKTKSAGSTLRKIYDQAMTDGTVFHYSKGQFGCSYIVNEKNAAICDISEAKEIITSEFSISGTCNYYLTDDKILASDNALAIQASKILLKSTKMNQSMDFVSETKSILGRNEQIHSPGHTDGCH